MEDRSFSFIVDDILKDYLFKEKITYKKKKSKGGKKE